VKWRDVIARADRIQKSRAFKIAASVVVVAAAIAVFSVYAVQRGLEATEGTLGSGAGIAARADGAQASGATPNPGLADGQAGPAAVDEEAAALGASAGVAGTTKRAMDRVLAGREDMTSLAVGLAVVSGLTIVVIWLGLFLTHLAIAVVIVGIAYPMTQFRPVRTYGSMLLGVAALAWAFNVGLAVVRLLYSGSNPVLSVARNVLSEAVRLKLSLVFILLLMFLLATLPMLLDPQTPLRYRVQAFLQYSTGGAFWLIAVLTLLFSVSTVTLEQRSKIIWQTMTKPVAAWQYILGKWLGVVGLNAVLLLVCSAGVFLFTEYLRSTPAMGEVAAYVPENRGERITEDRLILETQVLQARVSVLPPPDLSPDDPEFQAAVRDYIVGIQNTDPVFKAAENDVQRRAALDALYERMHEELYQSQVTKLRSIEPGQGRPFVFEGLRYAASNSEPLILRYKFDAGSNQPDESYRVTLVVGDRYFLVREASIGMFHAVPIAPVIVVPLPGSSRPFGVTVDDPQFADLEAMMEAGATEIEYLEAGDLIGPEGTLQVDIANGEVTTRYTNPDPMTFPPDGVEISYPHGGYRGNFVRVVLVLWVKLAFLAMLAIAASTFLSFPVACMVAMATFLAAESSGFLTVALETFNYHDQENQVVLAKYVIFTVASAVAGLFGVYHDLDPIGRIVDGRLLAWSSVAVGVGVLGGLTGVLYAAAVLVFRRRELATYSGQ